MHTNLWNFWVSTGKRCWISALPLKIPSRYTHRLCTSIHTSNRALIRFNLSSHDKASSSNSWQDWGTYNSLFRYVVFLYKYEYGWSLKKYLVVRREFHGRHRVNVFLHFVEEIIPSTNQFAFLLVVDQLQDVTTPYFTDLVINNLKPVIIDNINWLASQF